MSPPQVSIILPTRNRAYVLRQTLDGLRAQTFSDWELIVINDGSTDGTREMVASYQDPRFIYVQNEASLGAAKARNIGLARAQAEFIAFQDAGDDWLPENWRFRSNDCTPPPVRWGWFTPPKSSSTKTAHARRLIARLSAPATRTPIAGLSA